MIHVVFICLGNICRSPMAEAIFQRLVDDAGLRDVIGVDSAGTGNWHVGEPAHRDTRRVLRENGIEYTGRSRQVTPVDMKATTYVVAMDAANMAELRRRFGEHPRLYRLLDFAPDIFERDVPDPYYHGRFDHVYRLVEAGCAGLLAHITHQEQLNVD